ncbi:NAD(P)-dependent oxidoreductase [Candidatus Giovannonibacteria bacterium]|nr:NAD(P)-dependent oxidoreductase [Candidatus Giovannonibacteria bacterium]
MRIFVTGSESFIGRELIRKCLLRGIEVSGCDLVSQKSQNYDFRSVDIRSRELRNIIPENIDALVHLAAIITRDCEANPTLCYDVNLSGTVNVADSARERNAKQIIFASTEWVYGQFKPGEIKNEDSLIDPTRLDTDYALSKILSEFTLRERHNITFIPTTILRFGIIYGPRTGPASAVDSLFAQVSAEDEIKVNSLMTGRHFIHVSDICEGIIKSFGLPGLNIINLEGDRMITLGEVIETSKKLLGKNPRVIETNPSNISERRVSNSRAKKILGWRPEIDLETGLKALIKQ